jgi:hypothetical protein
MKNKTKAELLVIIENLTLQNDINFDKAEIRKDLITELEDEVSELQGKAETLNILIDLLDCYHIANQRYLMGIASELETIEKLTEKLLDMRSIN